MYNPQQDQSAGAGNQNQNSPFNRFCGGPGGRHFSNRKAWARQFFDLKNGNASAPVNIAESDAAYTLELFAAGEAKENFTIAVKDNILTIGYTQPKKQETVPENYIHRENYRNSFERKFQLNEKMRVDSITASYENGVLRIAIPKDPERAKPAQKVTIH